MWNSIVSCYQVSPLPPPQSLWSLSWSTPSTSSCWPSPYKQQGRIAAHTGVESYCNTGRAQHHALAKHGFNTDVSNASQVTDGSQESRYGSEFNQVITKYGMEYGFILWSYEILQRYILSKYGTVESLWYGILYTDYLSGNCMREGLALIVWENELCSGIRNDKAVR